jgi:hypothetical protein
MLFLLKYQAKDIYFIIKHIFEKKKIFQLCCNPNFKIERIGIRTDPLVTVNKNGFLFFRAEKCHHCRGLASMKLIHFYHTATTAVAVAS